MPKSFSQKDFNQIPVKGLVVESSATPPANPVAGQLWHDSVNDKPMAFVGGAWVDLSANTTYPAGTAAQIDTGTDTTTRVWSPKEIHDGIQLDAPVTSVAGKTGAVTLVKADVGLSVVDNTSDLTKPISNPTLIALGLKADLASPTFTGDPKAPTPAAGDNDTSVATTAFVQTALQNAVQGIKAKPSAHMATTANVALTGLQTIDTVVGVAGDIVLVKNQTNPAENRLYIMATGAWTVHPSMDVWSEVVSAFVFVEEGTQAETGWLSSANTGGTIGTTPIPFVQFSAAGQVTASGGLSKVGNDISIANFGVTTAKINDSAVTTQKIADNSVDSGKLMTDSVTETKMAPGSVDLAGTTPTGTLPLVRGGTGATTAGSARFNLDAAGKYSSLLPALVAGEWTTVNHGLNSNKIVVSFVMVPTYEQVELDFKRLDSSAIQVRADVAIPNAIIEVTVIG